MPKLGSKRTPPGMGRPIYAPVTTWEHIDAVAASRGMSRSEMIVLAVREYLGRTGAPIPIERSNKEDEE